MQIRTSNRQDEPFIRTLVSQVMTEFGLSYNIDRAESDLKSIEANYAGRDGVFLVAEEEGKIIGVAGACKFDDKVCDFTRLAVDKQWRLKGVARQLVSLIIKFARDMGYQRLEVQPARQYPGTGDALMRCGFTSDNTEDAQLVWYLDLQPVAGTRA